METAVEAFRFVHGYVIIFEFKIFATNRFRAVHDFGKKWYQNQECGKANYFPCRPTVYDMSYPNLFQALARNGKEESQRIEKFFSELEKWVGGAFYDGRQVYIYSYDESIIWFVIKWLLNDQDLDGSSIDTNNQKTWMTYLQAL